MKKYFANEKELIADYFDGFNVNLSWSRPWGTG